MFRIRLLLFSVLLFTGQLLWLTLFSPTGRTEEKPPAPLGFEIKEIDKSLSVGYAVLLVDVNNDGKKDIVVVDTKRVVWYENPSWKRRTIIQNQTKPDNVCICA